MTEFILKLMTGLFGKFPNIWKSIIVLLISYGLKSKFEGILKNKCELTEFDHRICQIFV